MTRKDNGVSSISDRLLKQRTMAANTGEPAFPTPPCSIRVNIDQLSSYDGNPRQSINPLYQEIKGSIRSRGLDHSPNITARPGSTKYMIKDGGNTRLKILRELWAETNDPKFYELECRFHPWIDELDTLAGHMVENELHGSMMLIDRALAAVKMQGLLLEKSGEKSMSIRKLATSISESGWSTNHSNLSVMLYAAESLLPYLPEALWGGMGRPAVKSVRKLHDHAAKYADHLGIDRLRFDDLWSLSLQESDASSFSYSDLFAAISNQLRQEKQIDGIGLVEAELDALLKGGTLTTDHEPSSGLPRDFNSGLSVSGSNQPIVTSQRSQNVAPTLAGRAKSPDNNESPLIGDKQGTSASTSSAQSQDQKQDLNVTRRDISDRARWIATNVEIDNFVSITTEGTGFEVALLATYTPAKDYIDIQAGVIALLAQFQSACLDYHPEQINELPFKICQTLFLGDWKRMASTLHQVTHIMRNDPEIVGDGLHKLYEIEPLIFELNKMLQDNRSH